MHTFTMTTDHSYYLSNLSQGQEQGLNNLSTIIIHEGAEGHMGIPVYKWSGV